ncbi:MAG TPA: hypothetical protein VGK32_07255 [Vicinamibacterales bacterium]
MKRTIGWTLGCVLALTLGSAGMVIAGQAQNTPPEAGGRANRDVLSPQDLEILFDSYTLLQAQETLRLTEAQFPNFLTRLKALQETRRRNLRARRQLVASLGQLLRAPQFDEAQTRERLKALRDLDARSAEELHRAYDAVDEVLEPAQQARFRIFEETVERKKIDLLLRARRAAAGAARPESPSR